MERSDVKDVTGKYPMMVGFDLGGIELGSAENLDGVPFGLIRKAAQFHVERGGIVTLSGILAIRLPVAMPGTPVPTRW